MLVHLWQWGSLGGHLKLRALLFAAYAVSFYGGHCEKLWLVRIWLWSVQDVHVNGKDAGKFCGVCASLSPV